MTTLSVSASAIPGQGVAMADYAMDVLGYTKIAVIYNNADDYSAGMDEAFEARVEEKGGEIVASESFTTGDTDFNTQLTKIKGTDAEALFIPAYYQDITYITKHGFPTWEWIFRLSEVMDGMVC